jgi:hypothetical protein
MSMPTPTPSTAMHADNTGTLVCVSIRLSSRPAVIITVPETR